VSSFVYAGSALAHQRPPGILFRSGGAILPGDYDVVIAQRRSERELEDGCLELCEPG